MKIIRTLFLGFLLAGGWLVTSVMAAETVRFTFRAPPLASVGEIFNVALYIDPAGQRVAQVPFIIGYDPAVLKVVSVEAGPFLGAGPSNVAFSPAVDSGEGRIRVDAASRDGQGRLAPDVLATVTFRVLRRFSTTPIQGMTMAPVTPEGEGLPPQYPETVSLRFRGR